jgi:hypothetical protein
MIFKVHLIFFLINIHQTFIINIDRCASTKCRDGETCILNKDGDAECACIIQCEDPKDERLMVKSFYMRSTSFSDILGLYKSQSYLYIGLRILSNAMLVS